MAAGLAGLVAAGCAAAPAVTYLGEAPSRGPIAQAVTATGEVTALVKVNVGSQVSGTVARLRVDFNSQVHRGDVLAELDPRLFVAQLGRAEASVAVAESAVDRAKVTLMDAGRTLRRTGELAARKMVAQADLDAAEVAQASAAAAVKGAAAGLLQARADRDLAATNVALTKIRSPIDGVVIDRQVDVGQTVAAQFQVATLFVIANDMRRVQVLVSVDEADVGKVRAGMPVSFSVDAFPQQRFAGTLREVRQAPLSAGSSGSSASSSSTSSSGSTVVTYAAVADADNPDYALRQGMTAQVTVTVQARADVLRLPNAALRFRPPEGTPAAAAAAAAAPPPPGWVRIFCLRDGAPVAAAVRLGVSDGRQSEVLEGVAPGDQVVLGASGHDRGAAGGPRRGPF